MTQTSIRSRSGPETRRWYRSGQPGRRMCSRDPIAPGVAARARVHRRHQLEPGREHRRASRPGDRDSTLLHGWRSASRTSRSNSGSSSRNSTPWSARVTSPGDKRGPPPTMAAYEIGVVRRAERRTPAQPEDRALTGGRGDDGRRQRRGVVERRAAAPGWSARAASCPTRAARAAGARAGPPARSRGLAAPPADLEPRPGRDASAEPSATTAGHRHRPSWRRAQRARRAAARPRHRLGRRTRIASTASDERIDAEDLDPFDEVRLVHGARCATTHPADASSRQGPQPSAAPPARTGPRHQATARRSWRPDRRPGRTCSDPRRIPIAIARSSDAPALRRSAGARLTVIRRGGIDKTGVAERAANTFAGFLEGRVREPDDGEPGQPGGNVHLDPDHPPIEAVKRRGWDDGQHPMQS